MNKTFIIDCFPESASLYRRGYAVVAVDVIRAMTTAITAVAAGRRCFPVRSIEEARELMRRLEHPLLAGEVAGDLPLQFEMNNSPVEAAARNDIERPMILLSSSGSKLLCSATECDATYLACFRNSAATARQLLKHSQIALIGAGSRGEFREEDQICCAWIAAELMDHGYQAHDARAQKLVDHWRRASALACASGNSARYLARTGQSADLEFVLQHINDIDSAFLMKAGEVVVAAEQDAEMFRPATVVERRPSLRV